MISAFNRRQTFRAIVAVILCLLAYAFGFGFFSLGYFMVGFLTEFSFPYDWLVIPGGILVVVTACGIWQARSGSGHYGYQDSDLRWDVPVETPGGAVVDFYAHRVTAPAHAATQILLAGPLQAIKAVALIRSRIPESAGLELKLEAARSAVAAKGGWHSLADHAEIMQEIAYLIRMEKVEFSPRGGRIKIAADSD